MTDRVRLLDRLTKLLALERSPNLYEADAATKLAERLMKKHKLTRGEVAAHETSGFYERPMGAKGFDLIWKFSLITATARFCGCEAIALQAGTKKKVRLVGERANVDQAAELFLSLLKMLVALEKVEAAWISDPGVLIYSSPKDYAISFRQGATVAIIELMQRLQPERFGIRRRHESREEPSVWSDPRVAQPVVPPRDSAAVASDGQALVLHASPRKSEKDYTEKVKAKYSPKRVKLHLEEPSDDGAYWRGYHTAKRMVVLPVSGSAGMEQAAPRPGEGVSE